MRENCTQADFMVQSYRHEKHFIYVLEMTLSRRRGTIAQALENYYLRAGGMSTNAQELYAGRLHGTIVQARETW